METTAVAASPRSAPPRRCRLLRAIALLSATCVAFAAAAGSDADAFWDHEPITRDGLSSSYGATGVGDTFIRRGVFRRIMSAQLVLDGGFNVGRDQYHFDDCEFNGGAAYIRGSYEAARGALQPQALQRGEGPFGVWGPFTAFGSILHPAQDFYSHSNWVELGFPRGDLPGTPEIEAAPVDLVDLSGAQHSLATRWFGSAFREVVRDDILLGADDRGVIPVEWGVARHSGGRHVPTIVDEHGRTLGRLLVSGESRAEGECAIHSNPPRADARGNPLYEFVGFTHAELNKDGPSAGRKLLHRKARALATLQTSHEWCRLVRETGLAGVDGALLTLAVKHRGDPHPRNSPCSSAPPGPKEVTVTIDRVRALRTGDGPRSGQVQLAAALYDDPLDFRRSSHRTGPSVTVARGADIRLAGLPGPLTICVDGADGAMLALHGWDNDQDGSDGPAEAADFDNRGDDDDVLVGFQRKVLFAGDTLPRVVRRTVRSDDLEVSYRVTATSPGPSCGAPPPLPDLVIESFDLEQFTVRNLGPGPAGQFNVALAGVTEFSYLGLAAGQSIRQPYSAPCGAPHRAIADSRSQVFETDEANNENSFVPVC